MYVTDFVTVLLTEESPIAFGDKYEGLCIVVIVCGIPSVIMKPLELGM